MKEGLDFFQLQGLDGQEILISPGEGQELLGVVEADQEGGVPALALLVLYLFDGGQPIPLRAVLDEHHLVLTEPLNHVAVGVDHVLSCFHLGS